jgi:hypothetical protein
MNKRLTFWVRKNIGVVSQKNQDDSGLASRKIITTQQEFQASLIFNQEVKKSGLG